jgi:hypothetical protein
MRHSSSIVGLLLLACFIPLLSSARREEVILTASDKALNNYFGTSTSASGNIAVIGAYGHNTDGVTGSGQAYIFRSASGGTTWNEIQKLAASDKAANNYFGMAVSIDGYRILVGAFYHAFSGAAYVFGSTDEGASWPSSENEKFTASDGASGDQFGLSVTVFGNDALIGAPGHRTGGIGNSGAAYVYEMKRIKAPLPKGIEPLPEDDQTYCCGCM